MSLRSSAYACALVAAMKLINKMVWMMCVRVYIRSDMAFSSIANDAVQFR